MLGGYVYFMSKDLPPQKPQNTIQTHQLERQMLYEKQLASLSPAQERAVRAAAQGLSASALAQQLGVSVRSIEDSRTKAVHKLETDSFKDVIRIAIGAGWGNEPPPLDECRKLMDSLSYRERQTVDFMVKGASAKDVAETLRISPRTVEMHYQHAMTKLGISKLPDLMGMVQLLEDHATSAESPQEPERAGHPVLEGMHKATSDLAEPQPASRRWAHPALAGMHRTASTDEGVSR